MNESDEIFMVSASWGQGIFVLIHSCSFTSAYIEEAFTHSGALATVESVVRKSPIASLLVVYTCSIKEANILLTL
jgi:hypothetical protein